MKKFMNKMIKNPWWQTVLIALALNFVVEALGRRSFAALFSYIISKPHMFLFNAAIIFLTLSLSFLFKKRLFTTCALSILWIALGVTNFIILLYRITPLAASDFKKLLGTITIVGVYLNPLLIMGVSILAAGLILGIIYVYKKTPKIRPKYVRSLATIFIVGASLYAIVSFGNRAQALPDRFPSLIDAYDEYGFPYCFAVTVLDTGINKPNDYSQGAVYSALNDIASKTQKKEVGEKVRPNVIILQLESFFDVNNLKDIGFSKNPIPNFTELAKENPSGRLKVPSVGGGTANTEFEILSSMDLKFFGAGEYPYKSVLLERVCESAAWDLKDISYDTHAIHNHTATFYGRDKVYKSLGFDTFTSSEFMGDLEYTPNGFEKDKVLTKEIFRAINSNDKKDFIFAVSVQPHGIFPDKYPEPHDITVSGMQDETKKSQLEYFVNQLYEADAFLGELTKSLEKLSEPTILLVYGDHLPAIDFGPDPLKEGTIYETEYVMWSNFGAFKNVEDENLTAHEITPKLLEDVGIYGSVMGDIRRMDADEETKDRYAQLIQYDMLYGERFFKENDRSMSDMTLGMGDIKISGVEAENTNGKTGNFMVYGANFTKNSVVKVNGDKLQTKFIDASMLEATGGRIKAGDILTVGQATSIGQVIWETDPFIYS